MALQADSPVALSQVGTTTLLAAVVRVVAEEQESQGITGTGLPKEEGRKETPAAAFPQAPVLRISSAQFCTK